MMHVLLDIEALGRLPGCAVVEVGAVAFTMEGGAVGVPFHRHVAPAAGLAREEASVRWHAENGTWPPAAGTVVAELGEALDELATWVEELEGRHGKVASFWSWGSTYDFPVMEAAYAVAGRRTPWRYWQACCGRTVWRLVFPERMHAPRPHDALEDARAAVGDLRAAVNAGVQRPEN